MSTHGAGNVLRELDALTADLDNWRARQLLKIRHIVMTFAQNNQTGGRDRANERTLFLHNPIERFHQFKMGCPNSGDYCNVRWGNLNQTVQIRGGTSAAL